MDKILFKSLNPKCNPKLNNSGLYDLVSSVDICIHPHNQCLVDSGVSVRLPDNIHLLICNTTVQACNGIIIPINSIITKSYADTIKIILVNNGINTYKIKAGTTKVAQFSVVQALMEQVSFQEYNDDTD